MNICTRSGVWKRIVYLMEQNSADGGLRGVDHRSLIYWIKRNSGIPYTIIDVEDVSPTPRSYFYHPTPSVLQSPRPYRPLPAVTYPVPVQEAGNALLTPLRSRVHGRR
ncbi:hypothetical protein EVAR_92469_1 [Eumeta japonica]|uniref:Uncharacterized protein n=1 Tax=Eumeta variegata TaxID=151549 RepID=A0A4C1T698_EUMVA|nr:hypothetical protein EVAR_92469_1 [Eumeta japonica]